MYLTKGIAFIVRSQMRETVIRKKRQEEQLAAEDVEVEAQTQQPPRSMLQVWRDMIATKKTEETQAEMEIRIQVTSTQSEKVPLPLPQEVSIPNNEQQQNTALLM